MKWVGITGGIASGKTKVSDFLRQAGFPVVDADELAREVVQPGKTAYQRIVQVFGPEILSQDGAIDRAALGRRVFSHSKDLRQLESMIHPEVKKLALQKRREIQEGGAKIAFYEVPLLFEKNLQKEFDEVVLVYCTQALQRVRMRQRDRLSDEEIEARLESQWPLGSKIEKADFIISNNGSLADLEFEVSQYLKTLKSK